MTSTLNRSDDDVVTWFRPVRLGERCVIVFETIIVAIPARDEAESIEKCLNSVDRAAGRVDADVCVVVAADTCTDNTVHLARSVVVKNSHLEVIEGDWGRAGAARNAAVETGLAESIGRRVWIANTDADCIVPPNWLQIQVALARRYDAVAGVVQLDPASTQPDLIEAFASSYLAAGGTHPHVHGANLGVSATSYAAAGGWCRETTVGEDHVLWNALSARGDRLVPSTNLVVTTSSRTQSRVQGGFATDLAQLAAS